MEYTQKENDELNLQLKIWQKRQMAAVGKNNIDKAYAKMNDIERGVWERIAKANTHKDVPWIVWGMAEEIITKFYKMAR